MAIEAEGSGSLGSNPSGVGAVYLGDMPDLLKIQKDTIEAAQKNRELDLREQALGQAKQNQKQNKLAELFKLANIDKADPLDTDRDMFTQKSNSIRQYIEDGLKMGVDVTQPGSVWHNRLLGMVDNVKMDAEISKYQKQQIAAALAKAGEKGYDIEATMKKIDEYAKLPFEQRNKSIGWSNLLVPIKESFVDEANKLIKDINTSGLSEKTEKTNVGPFVGVRTTKNMPTESLAALYRPFAVAHSDKLFGDWNKLDKNLRDFYQIQQQQTVSDPNIPQKIKDVVQDMTPQEYYGWTIFQNGVKSVEDIKDLKSLPGAEKEAEANIEAKKGDLLYRFIKGIANDNPLYFNNYDKENKKWLVNQGGNENELYSTQGSAFQIGMKQDAAGNPVPEYLTQVKKIRNDINGVYIRTSMDNEWKRIPINELANKLFINTYGDPSKGNESLNALQRMAQKDGTYVNGTIDFTRNFKPKTTVPAGTSVADIKSGFPQPIKPPQKQGKIDYSQYPQSSDGKWYFDGKEWKAIQK